MSWAAILAIILFAFLLSPSASRASTARPIDQPSPVARRVAGASCAPRRLGRLCSERPRDAPGLGEHRRDEPQVGVRPTARIHHVPDDGPLGYPRCVLDVLSRRVPGPRRSPSARRQGPQAAGTSPRHLFRRRHRLVTRRQTPRVRGFHTQRPKDTPVDRQARRHSACDTSSPSATGTSTRSLLGHPKESSTQTAEICAAQQADLHTWSCPTSGRCGCPAMASTSFNDRIKDGKRSVWYSATDGTARVRLYGMNKARDANYSGTLSELRRYAGARTPRDSPRTWQTGCL